MGIGGVATGWRGTAGVPRTQRSASQWAMHGFDASAQYTAGPVVICSYHRRKFRSSVDALTLRNTPRASAIKRLRKDQGHKSLRERYPGAFRGPQRFQYVEGEGILT